MGEENTLSERELSVFYSHMTQQDVDDSAGRSIIMHLVGRIHQSTLHVVRANQCTLTAVKIRRGSRPGILVGAIERLASEHS